MSRGHTPSERPVQIGIVGVVDGTDVPDPSGSYVKLVTFRGDNEDRREFRISIGCAEVFAAELVAFLHSEAPSHFSRRDA